MRGKALYSLLPIRDEFGERSLLKIKRFAFCCGCLLMGASLAGLAFFGWRLGSALVSGGTGDAYFGLLAALTSFLAIQAMSVAFGTLYLLGAYREQQSLIFLWLVSVFVLLALDTVVTVYSAALRDHEAKLWTPWARLELAVYLTKLLLNIPAIIAGVLLYRAVEDARRVDFVEREILL